MVVRITFLVLIILSLPFSHGHVEAAGQASEVLAAFEAQNVHFLEVTPGLSQPLFITNAGDGSGRLFIIERAGYIRIFKGGALLPVPFLDIHTSVTLTGSEQGLLALAFHPNYETNGQFYTVHTGSGGALTLSRFTRSAADPDLANPNSRVTLLTISHPTFTNHNGGTLAFGPDGYLYWSTGDGGDAGDPLNNAQNLSSLLGKILRLDVDSASPYAVPASNPFFNNVDPSVRKEIWAYGLRNPWRFSIDRQTGDIYIGDVGQGKREEIDFQPAASSGGENYGWRVMEGSLCYNPSTGCNQSGKTLPVAEYDHTLGCSVTGGYVYRGTQYPQMNGIYFYGDYCSGRIFSLYKDPADGWVSSPVVDTAYMISSFGEDEQGELYLTDYGTGKIYQIIYGRPPVQAKLIAPSGDITDTHPTFSWNEVLDSDQGDAATWYYLWVDGPSGNVIKQWYTSAQANCNGTTCSVVSPVDLAGGRYTWWVRTWNPAGYGPWSAGMTFSLPVSPPPIAATLVSPVGEITDNQPTYIWNAVLDSAQGDAASWYQLYVEGPSGLVLNQWYEATAVCSGATCSIDPGITLGGASYTWWVRTWNSGGYGPWSAGMSFSLPVPKPPIAATLVSPTGTITDNQPTYTWNAVLGTVQGDAATWYYLWVDGPSGKVFNQWYPAQDVCTGGTCSVTPNITFGGGSHTWWVRTWNPAGYGPWSAGMSFSLPVLRLPIAATLVSPSGNITDTQPTYTWNPVLADGQGDAASWYQVYIGGPSGVVLNQWYEASLICGGTSCSVHPLITLTTGNYSWWVRTWNGAGYGPWSSRKDFTVVP